MKIVQATAYTGVEKGGPTIVVPFLTEGLIAAGAEISVVAQTWPNETPVSWPDGAKIQTAFTTDTSGFGYNKTLKPLLQSSLKEGELLHSHGLWMHINRLSAQVAKKSGRPHIITPHGMLEPWALANSARKKQIMRRLFQDQSLRGAACLHALCTPEAENLRALGFTNPIAVIPNGIHLNEFAALPPKNTLSQEFPYLQDCKIILFMARLHPKKGLLHLVEAWSQIAKEFPDWHLVIAGPDEGGYRATVENTITQFELDARITLTGMLEGSRKLAALGAADIFVLPSFSEGFSMAILEAMACRLPILLTPGCNFPEAIQTGAALEVAADANATAVGLRQLLEMSTRERCEMGQRSFDLVIEHYTWQKVAAAMKSVYQWCLGGGDKPCEISV